MKRLAFAARLLLLGLVTACSDRQPVSLKSPSPRVDGAVLAWIPMGRYTFGSDGPTGELSAKSTGLSIPPGVWAKVWVRGGLAVSYNSAYDAFCTNGGVDGARDCGGTTYKGVVAGPFGLSDESLVVSLAWTARMGARTWGWECRPFDPQSHAYLYAQVLADSLAPAVEPIIGTTVEQLADGVEARLRPIAQSAKVAGDHADDVGMRPTWCTFTYTYPRP